MFNTLKGEQRMNRMSGIKLLAALVGVCLVTATASNAAVVEYRLLVNGVDTASYSGAAGDINLSVEVRTVDNIFASAGGNNYLGGMTQFAVYLIDSTGIEAGSILEPKEYIDVVIPGVLETPTGTWESATVGDMASNHTRGKLNGISQAGSDMGTAYDVAADYSYIPQGSLGANSMTFGGGAVPAPGTTGNWAEVLSGQFTYNGGIGTLTLVSPANENLLYGPGGTQPNPTSVIGDMISFGANETPTVTLGADILEADWSDEPDWNNLAHSVVVVADGQDGDSGPSALTYDWTMKNAVGTELPLGEHGGTLTLTLGDIQSLGLPAFPGEVWTLSVTAFDGLATSDPATIGVFIPEPTTMGLLGFGIVALLKRRRRA